MALFNNHVHISQMQALTANSWDLTNKSLSLGGVGLFPKYELSPSYTLVLAFEPKSGLLPWMFSWIKPKNMLQTRKTESLSSWINIFPWYWSLSHKARGVYVQNKRRDSLQIAHTINEHGIAMTYTYQVDISAEVVPEKYFTFLLTNVDNSGTLLTALQNCIAEKIEQVLREQAFNPSFIRHFRIEEDTLMEAGYMVNDIRVQYVS